MNNYGSLVSKALTVKRIAVQILTQKMAHLNVIHKMLEVAMVLLLIKKKNHQVFLMFTKMLLVEEKDYGSSVNLAINVIQTAVQKDGQMIVD